MPYIGRGPELGVRSRFIYTATANQTSFSGNDDAGISLAYTDTLYMDVYQNGVLLVPATDYAASTGTSVVLVQGASVDDTVEILVHDIFSVADSVSAKDGGSFAGNVGMGGTLSVTGATTLTGVVTANGGIDVTGTVTADGLTVDGTAYVTTLAGQSDTNTFIRFDGSDVMTFRTGNSERMRMDGSGRVFFNGTTALSTSQTSWRWDISGTQYGNLESAGTMQSYRVGGTAVGSIYTGASSTTYNTSSDHRLKENVTYNWDATTRLKQLKPARFNWIIDDTNTLLDGFIAHEVSSIVPEAITGTKDEVDDNDVAVMQGIDQSKLVPLLVKTIQELEARITALEA